MTGVDPRQPVIVGAGQLNDREYGSEPIDLMTRCVEAALDDSGAAASARERIEAHYEVFAKWMRDRQGIDPELIIREGEAVPDHDMLGSAQRIEQAGNRVGVVHAASLLNATEARAVIEGEAVALAANMITAEELEQLEQSLHDMAHRPPRAGDAVRANIIARAVTRAAHAPRCT